MTELIKKESTWNTDLKSIHHSEHRELTNLLLGRKVAKVADNQLELDDGTVMKIIPNEGCGGCSSGHYKLTDLNDCDNVITSVEFETLESGRDDYGEGPECTYRVFVVAEDKRINLFAVEGDDGNGYYGTGYEILVRMP